MKLTLKDFQEDAVDLLRKEARRAADEAVDRGQALVLSAPTGSGKTVIAAAWMELLRDGDDEHPPDPDATFLWLTDQPELNEQTRRKMLAGSSSFSSSDLVPVENTFDAEVFPAGKVFFLNTGKLMKGGLLVKEPGDDRDHTLWDTVNNTAAVRPGSFWVVIDEAHRGTGNTKRQRAEADTIMQRFILGWNDALQPVPLVLGISATPQKFNELLAGPGEERIRRPVTIDPELVRASGLLKHDVNLYNPRKSQAADITLLKEAAEDLKRFETEWAEYADAESEPTVRPILVVQVQDAGKAKGAAISKTDLAEAVRAVEDVLGPLGKDGIAHSFQENSAISGEHRGLLRPSRAQARGRTARLLPERSGGPGRRAERRRHQAGTVRPDAARHARGKGRAARRRTPGRRA